MLSICDADPIDRIEAVRNGLPARWLVDIAAAFGWSRARLIEVLGLKPSATVRRIRADQSLDLAASERLLALLDLIVQVQRMVERSGRIEGFDVCEWLGDWLERPVGALGFRTGATFLDTNEGVGIVRRLIARMESGAYS